MGLDDWLGFQATGLVWVVESLHQSLLFTGFAVMVFCLPLRSGFLPHFKRPFFPFLISVPLIWIFFHWIVGTSEFFLGMPVNQMAYSQSKQTELIQIAKIGGSGLVDFIIILANAAAAETFIDLSGLARRLRLRVDQISIKVGCVVDAVLVLLLVLALKGWGYGQLQEMALATAPDNPDNYYLQTPD
jgi:apolipoprotein N-acyltransferase